MARSDSPSTAINAAPFEGGKQLPLLDSCLPKQGRLNSSAVLTRKSMNLLNDDLYFLCVSRATQSGLRHPQR